MKIFRKKKHDLTKVRTKRARWLPWLLLLLFLASGWYFLSPDYRNSISYIFADDNERLLYSAAIDNVDLMRDLLQHMANPDTRDIRDWTPLHFAAHEGHNKQVELLIQAGAAVNAKNNHGWTPLHWAVYQKHPETVLLLLQNRADIHARNWQGNAPLHIAVFIEDYALVKLFLDSGAEINLRNYSGSTALDYAVHQQSSAIIELLLSRNADPESTKAKSIIMLRDSFTPLARAAMFGNSAIVIRLLGLNVAVSPRDNLGNTPLHEAAKYNHPQVVGLLLQFSADPFARNDKGQSPADLAATPVIRRLITTYQLQRILELTPLPGSQFNETGNPSFRRAGTGAAKN